MNIYGLEIPDKPLTNFELLDYVKRLQIPNFKGPFMRDELPKTPEKQECGVVNFNTSKEPGSHWVGYYKDGDERIYFDSFGQVIPTEIQKYLKTKEEFEKCTSNLKKYRHCSAAKYRDLWTTLFICIR